MPLQMHFRKADIKDVDLVYEWANDPITRAQSFSSEPIVYQNHVKWFEGRMSDSNHHMLIFVNEEEAECGMVRFDLAVDHSLIGVNVAPNQRGKGYASHMLKEAVKYILNESSQPVHAYIKEDNIASIKSFSKAGFEYDRHLVYNNIKSVLYICK